MAVGHLDIVPAGIPTTSSTPATATDDCLPYTYTVASWSRPTPVRSMRLELALTPKLAPDARSS